jgi:hypothetical protein
MNFLSRLNRPWLHFIVLGGLLYYLQGVLFPTPKPVIGPLPPERVESLREQFFASTRRMPTDEQVSRMVDAELDRDMLFQRAIALHLYRYDTVVYQRLLRNMRFLQLAEGKTDEELYRQALEMRLHLGDEVVKRRMIQVMEQLMLAANPPSPVTEEMLAAEFEERREALRRPPRYSIEHLYFSREREADMQSAIDTITREELDAAAARDLGAPFLPGYRFTRQSPDQLARHFGAAFVENLQATDPQPGAWSGPVRSTYGLHYVWVEDIEPAREAQLEEVRSLLQRDIEARLRAEALREATARLREQYEVIR